MKDPREFPVMDDDPRNNGWGYSSPNPYDDYIDEREDELEEDDSCDDDYKEDDNYE